MADFSSTPSAAPSVAASVEWIRDLLCGSVGTSLAVLAIAWVGFALLQGRMPLREGARVILGCFILFAAPVIVAAFLQMAHSEVEERPTIHVQDVPLPIATPAKPPQFDPYAGASMPNH